MKRFCVDEETIMDYLEGRLEKHSRKRVEQHLCGCADCRRLILLTSDLMFDDWHQESFPAPSAATQRAIEVVKTISRGRANWKEQLGENKRKLIDNARSLAKEFASYPEPQVVLRSGPMLPTEDFTQYHISMAGTEGTIAVEKMPGAAYTVQVRTTSGRPLEKAVRVTLFADNIEIASATLLDETVQFEDIPSGSYVVQFSQAGRELDTYHLEI